MELKGTKSEQNVKAALQGESIARNKYTYFALQARSEGHEDIAMLFEKMADNEKEHAKIWFKILNDGLGETAANLQESAGSENYEWKSMYPNFAAEAKSEGFDMLAAMFERIAAIENDHERRFLETFLKLKSTNGSDTQKVASPSSTIAEKKTNTFSDISVSEDKKEKKYRCMFCGCLESQRVDVCPVCEAIGSFEYIK